MQQGEQFPLKTFYQTLSNTAQVQAKFKYFINEYKDHNMNWIYQSIAAFQKILSNPKQMPILKFNTLLAIKYCFDSCEYALITLIQVYLLNKITQVALFRTKVKDQTMLVTYFTTEGYRQSDHVDLKKISYNYVMLAIQFVFISSQVKKFRTVQNIQIKQISKYSMSTHTLIEKGIKRPEKFSFFLSDYATQNNKRYQKKLKEFGDQVCDIYSEYFLSIMIGQLQTSKKGPLQIRALLAYGDAYLTSAMINLCEDQLNSTPEGLQNKRKYLGLFNEFVRWGDIQAVLMVNSSQFVTKISVNVCTVRGDINLNQGENIYPQIAGKKNQKRQFYTDYLRCIQTWAQCIPLNQQGIESNVRRIYIFLKDQKKFKFPENLILKRYKKQLQQNLKKNQQRNEKLLQIINQIESQQKYDQSEGSEYHSPPGKANNNLSLKNQQTQKITYNNKNKASSINFDYLQDQIDAATKGLQDLIDLKYNQKQVDKKIKPIFQKLKFFKDNWVEWLQKIDLDNSQIEEEDQEKLEQIILTGDETMEAIQIIYPLIQMHQKNKISLEQLLKRIKQSLQIHHDLSISRSKQLQLTKSLGMSLKKSISNTIHKSILNSSAHKIITASKFDRSNHQNQMGNSLYQSKSQTSSLMRKSKMHSKLNKIKQNSSQIGHLIESRNVQVNRIQNNMESIMQQKAIQKQSFKHVGKQVEEYFQQNNSIALRNQEIIKEETSEYSRKSLSREKASRHSKKQSSLKSSKQNKASQVDQSLGSSRNLRSQKNITVVSRNNCENNETLEQQSKKVVADMNISQQANNIVVQYSDIDQNQFQQKANQREKQQKIKNQLRKEKKKQFQQAFAKLKPQEKKQQMTETKKSEVSKSGHSQALAPSKQNLSSKKIQSNSKIETNRNVLFPREKIEQANKKQANLNKNVQIASFPTKDKLANRLTPLNQDYGGKNKKLIEFDEIQTPRRQQRLQKTKKSQSKISISSYENEDCRRSSRSLKSKLKSRISQRKSRLRQQTQRSLESQLRQMREDQIRSNSQSSGQMNLKKQKLKAKSPNDKYKLKVIPNQQYNHLPNKLKQFEKIDSDLHKTKKISQIKEDLKNRGEEQSEVCQFEIPRQNRLKRPQIFEVKSNQRRIQKYPLTKNIPSSSLDSNLRKNGISLSLGKKGSYITKEESFVKKYSIIKYDHQEKNKDAKGLNNNELNLREQYFNKNKQKQKQSNRQRIKKKMNSNRLNSDSDSSCGDIIQTPNHKPMLQSHYKVKQLQNKLLQQNKDKLQFKKYIQNDIKKEIICPKSKQIKQIIKYGGKRHQIENIIQHNPYKRKAKSEQKYFYGSFLKQKSKQNQVSQLQDKLKVLQTERRNMKTKLAVRDQEIKQFKNSSERGFVEFTVPSQSNYYTSSEGFKNSKITSDKGLLSPNSFQLLKTEFQNSSLIANLKHAKSTPYNQYFQKVKGNTFRKSLLKSKSLIQKQQQIQIGCMSVRKDDFSLQITVFITPLRFDLTDIAYSMIHDQNISTDCYPKKVNVIELKKQQKIHIRMNIRKVPFSIPQIELTYKSKSQYSTNYFRLPIPTLFNKFCQLENVSIQSFDEKTFSPDRMIITSQFKLNTKVIKMDKIKQVLPNFSCTKTKQLHVLTSSGKYKQSQFLIILKINEKNHAIIEGILEKGQNFKYLQFLLITLKNIFQVEK